MENKQRVFIRGVEGRGDEVRQALINLGGKNVHDFCYGDTEGLFFINHNGEIRYASEFSEMGKIIMDCYTELHLPEKWKDEDILVSRSNSQVMALYEFVSDKDADLFNAYFRIDDNMIFSHSLEVRDRFRLATDQEIERFYDLLHIHHKDWDSENKRLVDWKWKPKDGEDYYYIISNGIVHLSTWFDYKVDNSRFSIGNCFKTKEEAEIMAEKFIKLLKGKS